MMAIMNRGGGGGSRMQLSMQGRGFDAEDLSKIIYLEPGEAKKISIVLDNQPRAMLVNTLFSMNLPGEINLPINDIIKSRDRVLQEDSEVRLPGIPSFANPDEMIVDNEDTGFVNIRLTESNKLKKILGVKREQGEVYGVVNLFNAPDYWQPVIQSTYYGKFVRSAVYIRAGEGDKTVTWRGTISKPGYYDVYTYVGKAGDRVMFRQGPGGGPGGQGMPQMDQQRDNPYRDLHFKVFHDEGVEEVTIEYESAEPGWNKLGTYYLSPDSVKVSLSNQSQGRIVIGDAVKWVIQR
jgi:hypothetical protein